MWLPSNWKWLYLKPSKPEAWLLHTQPCSFCSTSFSVLSDAELIDMKTKCLGNSIRMAFFASQLKEKANCVSLGCWENVLVQEPKKRWGPSSLGKDVLSPVRNAEIQSPGSISNILSFQTQLVKSMQTFSNLNSKDLRHF